MTKLFWIFLVPLLVNCGGGSGTPPRNVAVGEDSVGVFNAQKILSAEESEKFDMGCTDKTEIDQRLAPGLTFRFSARYTREGQPLQDAAADIQILEVGKHELKKRLIVRNSTISKVQTGLKRDFTCKVNADLVGLDCGKYDEIGAEKTDGPNDSEDPDYCALKGGSPDPKDTYEVSIGTFTFAEGAKTVKAYRTKRVRFGTYKCNGKEGPGREEYSNVISDEVPSFFGKNCRGTHLFTFAKTLAEDGRYLHSSNWETRSVQSLK